MTNDKDGLELADSNDVERAGAKRFADELDSASNVPHDTNSSEDLTVAKLITAQAGDNQPAPGVVASLLDEAYASDGRENRRSRRRAETIASPSRKLIERVVPWMIAAMAVGAAVILTILGPESAPPAIQATQHRPIHRSRPSDNLIGPIGRQDNGNARARLDVIYRDRLAGYRDLHLQRSKNNEGGE